MKPNCKNISLDLKVTLIKIYIKSKITKVLWVKSKDRMFFNLNYTIGLLLSLSSLML